jgi:hypothetical protein
MTPGPRLLRLIELGTGPLSDGSVGLVPSTGAGCQLGELLETCNGFVALRSALVVRGFGDGLHDIPAWNAPHRWRDAYRGMAGDVLFFAEDIFGSQFGLLGDRVVSFEPETGELADMASDLDAWAGLILEDPDVLTGYPLAAEWQTEHGSLAFGDRLLPKRPFVLGGDFDVTNLYALDSTAGMRLRGELAVQLRDLPDGAPVTFTVVD